MSRVFLICGDEGHSQLLDLQRHLASVAKETGHVGDVLVFPSAKGEAVVVGLNGKLGVAIRNPRRSEASRRELLEAFVGGWLAAESPTEWGCTGPSGAGEAVH